MDIAEKLNRVSSLPEKRRMAKWFLERYEDAFGAAVPRGYQVLSRFEWGRITPETMEGLTQRDYGFFEELDKLFGEEKPEVLRRLTERFRKNADRMLALSRMTDQERGTLLICDLPPFFDGFDTAVKLTQRLKFSDAPYTFLPEILGRGGIAEVYKAIGKDGKKYALKIFHSARGRESEYPIEVDSFGRGAMENVRRHMAFLSQNPFVAPVFVPEDPYFDWYVMEFFDGQSVIKLLQADYIAVQSPDFAPRIFLAYAEMLKLLHSTGRVFGDNNWGAVLVGADDIKICDYDTVSFQTEINQPGHFAAHTLNKHFASREQLVKGLPITSQSELESFALMIDAVFNGYDRRPIEEFWEDRKQQAIRNLRKYPGSRRGNLPSNLGQVVSPLIRYPRDDSVDLDDFIQAIKRDYGV